MVVFSSNNVCELIYDRFKLYIALLVNVLIFQFKITFKER